MFGALLQPVEIDIVRANSWYVAPRNGHISTYSYQTLALLAEKLRLMFYRGVNIHAFSTFKAGNGVVIASRVAVPLECIRLCAPTETPAVGWHVIEGSGPRRFRWSTVDTLSWQITVSARFPRMLQITILFACEPRQNFAAECTLFIDGQPVKTAIRSKSIFTEIGPVESTDMEVTLRTPALADAKKNSDGRGASIAVMLDARDSR